MTKDQFRVQARQDIKKLFTQAEELEKYKDQLPGKEGYFITDSFHELHHLAVKLQNEYNDLFLFPWEKWDPTQRSFLDSRESFRNLLKNIENHLN